MSLFPGGGAVQPTEHSRLKQHQDCLFPGKNAVQSTKNCHQTEQHQEPHPRRRCSRGPTEHSRLRGTQDPLPRRRLKSTSTERRTEEHQEPLPRRRCSPAYRTQQTVGWEPLPRRRCSPAYQNAADWGAPGASSQEEVQSSLQKWSRMRIIPGTIFPGGGAVQPTEHSRTEEHQEPLPRRRCSSLQNTADWAAPGASSQEEVQCLQNTADWGAPGASSQEEVQSSLQAADWGAPGAFSQEEVQSSLLPQVAGHGCRQPIGSSHTTSGPAAHWTASSPNGHKNKHEVNVWELELEVLRSHRLLLTSSMFCLSGFRFIETVEAFTIDLLSRI